MGQNIPRVGVLIVVLVSIASSGCTYSDRIAGLEKQTDEIRKELDAQKRIVDLDTQAQCANAAKALFMSKWQADEETIQLDYNNHYNKSLSKCFIRVDWDFHPIGWVGGIDANTTGDWFSITQIYDVYENSLYALLNEEHISTSDQDSSNVHLLHCFVAGQACKSDDEFTRGTRHYMVD